ncbi:MAG: hypothetical protein GX458_09615, partial [Phyllobacteriaceae bacterium]|nr:hypothetical protein [Phyllobacteriaceae bacterium]
MTSIEDPPEEGTAPTATGTGGPSGRLLLFCLLAIVLSLGAVAVYSVPTPVAAAAA